MSKQKLSINNQTNNKQSAIKKIMGATIGSLIGGMILTSASVATAGGTIKVADNKSISIGMGLRSSLTIGEDNNDFNIEEARVYMSGQLNKDSKFTFNTKAYDIANQSGSLAVLDAIIQYEPNKMFNIWMGQMLTPADRIEMNGPFYALSWNQYNVPLFPSDQGGEAGLRGRDQGLTVWGAAGKFQYAVGIFDGLEGGANKDDNFLFAGRFAYNFLAMEANPGYYTSSTYYGGLGDVFTVAVSAQQQTTGAGDINNPVDFMGAAIDIFYETKLGSGDVITLEGEYKVMDADTTTGFAPYDGESYFATAAYMLGNPVVGKGKMQPYVRYLNNETSSDVSSTLTEVGINYIISGHNLRFNLNMTDGDATIGGGKADESLQTISFGMQQQF